MARPSKDPKDKLQPRHPRRLTHYEDDEGVKLLAQLRELRGGISVAMLLRQLTREEAARRKL